MPIFISQGRYTRDAIRGMTAKPEDRSRAAAKLLREAGGKLLSYYITFGEYDFLLLAEAPNEIAIASAVLAAAGTGGVTDLRTTLALTPADAMKAFEGARTLAQSFQAAGAGGLASLGQGGETAGAGRGGAGRAAGAGPPRRGGGGGADAETRDSASPARTRGGRVSTE
jgi:uncharacterized protein with GYD domain